MIENNNENTIICEINDRELNKKKKTEEQIIKSVINDIIDQSCNQSTIEDSDKTVSCQSKKNVRRRRSDPSKWKKNEISNEKKKLKKPKVINCLNCKFKCSINFNEHYRIPFAFNFGL